MALEQYDRVQFTTDRFRNEGVLNGAIGYIIEKYSDGALEVEISNPQTGITVASVVAQANEVRHA